MQVLHRTSLLAMSSLGSRTCYSFLGDTQIFEDRFRLYSLNFGAFPVHCSMVLEFGDRVVLCAHFGGESDDATKPAGELETNSRRIF